MVKRNDAVVVFDSKHKEVILLPVGFFKDKESSILEQPEEVPKEVKKQFSYGDNLFAEGRDYELGLNGERQDFSSAFNCYYKGIQQEHPGCCLKVAFYFLYGLGCGFKSKALFEVYLHKAAVLGSETAKAIECRWNTIPEDRFAYGFDLSSCSFPVQSW